jgi:hypothetical protein
MGVKLDFAVAETPKKTAARAATITMSAAFIRFMAPAWPGDKPLRKTIAFTSR